MFVLKFSHCNEPQRVRPDKRFMKVMANRARASGSPLPRQVFLRCWVEKECRERPPENDGWRVVAEETRRKGRDMDRADGSWHMPVLEALLFYTTRRPLQHPKN